MPDMAAAAGETAVTYPTSTAADIGVADLPWGDSNLEQDVTISTAASRETFTQPIPI